MAPFTITIQNTSGSKQSYAVFAEPPTVNHSVKVRTHIIAIARNVPSGSGRANFILSKDIYATCGTSDVGSDGNDTGTEIIDLRAVQLAVLGDRAAPGKPGSGTRLEVDCSDDTPCFSGSPYAASAETGHVDDGSFAIRTKDDFTAQKAFSYNYFIGLTSSSNQSAGPCATFVPNPDTTYQIKPSNKFYVVAGTFEPRAIIDSASLGKNAIGVDFRRFPTGQAILYHDRRGNIRIKNSSPTPHFIPTKPVQAQDYNITVINNSSINQTYVLLTEASAAGEGANDPISNAFSTANTPAGQNAIFTITNKPGGSNSADQPSSTDTVFYLMSVEKVKTTTMESTRQSEKFKIDFTKEAPNVTITNDEKGEFSFEKA